MEAIVEDSNTDRSSILDAELHLDSMAGDLATVEERKTVDIILVAGPRIGHLVSILEETHWNARITAWKANVGVEVECLSILDIPFREAEQLTAS